MEDSRNRRVNVLLVEDDRIDQMAFERLVKDEGLSWDYVVAGALSDAKKFLSNDNFDCVIADFSLGDGTALDILNLVKTAPVIITTGSGDEEVAVKAMKAGAYDYLIKDPHRNYLTVLSVTVENAIKHKAQEKRLGMLSHAMMNISDSVYIADMDNRIIFVNNAFCNTYGYEEEEIIGRDVKCFELGPAGDEATKHGPPKGVGRGWAGEMYHKRKDGGEFPAFLTRSIMTDGNSSSVAVVIVRDLTEKKQAEDALRKSERRYRRITSAVTDYIFTVRIENGRPVETIHGPGCIAVIGYTPEEFASNPHLWIEMVHEEDRDVVHELAERVLLGQEPRPIEHRILRKDGVMSWVRNTLVPQYDAQGKLVSYDGLIHDITDQKNLEAQLNQAQKMEAIGTLAGGIAHDFNNLLMAVQGNVSLMLYDIDAAHPHHEGLKNIEKQVKSGARLTRQLLGYARKGRYDVKPINLNQLVEETSETFGRTRKELTIYRDLTENLFAIEVDEGQIEQVLLNLYVNASDAIPRSGDLCVKTMNVAHEDMKGKLYAPKPGNYVLLEVSDTGTGMDKETQERIFDPFFTTKEMGRGTGLGLASVYGIIKGHGGYIDVDSEKGKGTTFSIYLPATAKRAEKSANITHQIVKGNETVLLVDDEEVVLDVGAKLLKKLGYSVLEAKGGREALEIYEANKENVDLVILDMIMPDMGGDEAYERIRKIDGNLKVLLSSGYSIDGHATEILERGFSGFIQKPFSLNELSGKIREILD